MRQEEKEQGVMESAIRKKLAKKPQPHLKQCRKVLVTCLHRVNKVCFVDI